MGVVAIKDLLEAGVHFGHQTNRWNPKMKRFLFGERNGVYIIDLQQTVERLEQAYAFARDTVSWTFWPSLVMAIVVLALGELMLTLFGPDFVAGYPLLFLLCVGVVARSAVGPAESLLTMTGNENVCAFVYALTLTLNILLSVALIPLFGLWGAAIATAAAMVFEAAALSFTVWRRLGIAMAIFVPARMEAKG